MEAQKRLFEIIKSKLPDQLGLADMIGDLLEIGSNSVYRRIRGEQELTFSELRKICEKFNISMDDILNYKSAETALFNYNLANLSDQDSFIRYLQHMTDELIDLKSASDKEIIATAQDIPFYHFAQFPELALFRLYVWYYIWDSTPVAFDKFCERMEKNKIVSVYEKAYHAQLFVPTKEIWSLQTIDIVLSMIDYYYEINAFDGKETALLLLGQLTQLIEKVNQQANDGYKDDERKTPFNQYVCSVNLGNTFMLARRENHLLCRVRFFTFNSIFTDNEFICTSIQKWMNDLISKSILISGVSVKERNQFYQSLKSQIEGLVNKIELS